MAKTQKSCLVCSKKFATYIKTQRFCSHKCAASVCPPPQKIAKGKLLQQKDCLQCGKCFSQKYEVSDKDWLKTKYCSVTCLRLAQKLKSTPTCHPDRKHYSRGLCMRCYRRSLEYKKVRRIYRTKPRVREQHIAYMEEWRRKNREHRVFYRFKRLYGMTKEKYLNLVNAQNNKCAICFSESTERRLAVDHDHLTGNVRGLLCNQCNRGLGYLKDDITRLRSAIDYLEKHSSKDSNHAWVGY